MKFVSPLMPINDLGGIATTIVQGLASGLSVLPLMGTMLLVTLLVLLAD